MSKSQWMVFYDGIQTGVLTIEEEQIQNTADAFAFGWSTLYPFVVLHERKTMPLITHYKRT